MKIYLTDFTADELNLAKATADLANKFLVLEKDIAIVDARRARMVAERDDAQARLVAAAQVGFAARGLTIAHVQPLTEDPADPTKDTGSLTGVDLT